MGPLCLAPASFFPGCVATGLSRPMRPLLGPPPHPSPTMGPCPQAWLCTHCHRSLANAGHYLISLFYFIG